MLVRVREIKSMVLYIVVQSLLFDLLDFFFFLSFSFSFSDEDALEDSAFASSFASGFDSSVLGAGAASTSFTALLAPVEALQSTTTPRETTVNRSDLDPREKRRHLLRCGAKDNLEGCLEIGNDIGDILDTD